MKKRVLTVLLVLLVVAGAIFAVNAADAQDKAKLTLSANQTVPLNISEDTILDLKGHDVTAGITVADGANLYIMDSADGVGKITGTITGKFMSVRNYVPLKINGAYSFREGDFALENAAYLRTKDIYSEGASVYFKGNIGADNDVIAENVAAHGVAMRLADGEYFADGKAGGETFTSYTGWVSSDDNEINKLNSVELTGIMRRGNSAAINNRNAEYVVYCAPYVEMANGERLLGEEIRCSLKQLIEQVNTGWDNADWVTYDHKAAMVTFNQAFPGVLPKWNTIGRINSLIDPAVNTQANPFSIQDADDLVLASKASVKNFRLDKDIDMSAVKDWKPFTTFSGTFNGNNKKISNLMITGTSYATSVGFIGINNGTVTNLHLRDVTVDASGSNATAVGTIAGTNNGTITGVTATGSLNDTREGTEAAPIFAGAFVGYNAGNVTGGNSITLNNQVNRVTGAGKSTVNYPTTGLAANVNMFVADSEYVKWGLVGFAAEGSVATGTWRDTFHSTERLPQSVQEMRTKAADYMNALGTVEWKVDRTLEYYQNKTSWPYMESSDGSWVEGLLGTASGKVHTHNQQFKAGKTYVGVPYAHNTSPIENFDLIFDENMVLKSSIASLNNGYTSFAEGSYGFTKWIGADCSGAVSLAWQSVSPAYLGGNDQGVKLRLTENTTPSQYNQTTYGIRTVGDYIVDDNWFKNQGDVVNEKNPISSIIVEKNTAEVIYEAYSHARKGDALIYTQLLNKNTDVGGHTMMLTQDPVTVRDASGAIDIDNSYVVISEVGAGLYDAKAYSRVSAWRVNYKYTFRELLEGMYNSAGTRIGHSYLPITMRVYSKNSAPAAYAYDVGAGKTLEDQIKDNVYPITTPNAGYLNSNYRFNNVTVKIWEKDNPSNVVYQKTAYMCTSKNFDEFRGVSISVNLESYFSDYDKVFSEGIVHLANGRGGIGFGKGLIAGQEYTFSVTCTLSNGDVCNGFSRQNVTEKTFTYTPAA